ncbi:SigB/SigF/SigG family RNA polymerase sigma factor [Miniphocaeibacter massiliensis]|uniref:SigB/SigF/SigG family RNA polymerase sigma factor n=1 Tax=Miniphocaeibacter massiliensis TaxID=2041841 RepID=UPI000C1C3AD7|nr:SigB/SigF/SigG family RNA polymerase sigma factor [Miniphocaeibacter massiliensis]
MNNDSKQAEQKEIKKLFEEYSKNRDKKTRDILIEKNLYIAEILAKKYVNKGIEYDDLFQVASIGLILAIERYDISKGFEFSSYATPTIVGEIKKYFRDKGWVIRVPRRIQELSKKVNNAKTHLSQLLQKSPTIQDIAEYLNITEEEVIEALEGSRVYAPQSLDVSLDSQNEDREVNLQDLIGQEDEDFAKIEMRDFIDGVMKNLNELEKKILIDRYFEKKTQVSIAKELNISQMTVSRMEKKIIEKFRNEMEETNA